MKALHLLGVASAIVMVLVLASLAPSEGHTSGDVGTLVEANNSFAFELYSKLAETPGNLFSSPYSISNGLALAYSGAKGKTADEINTTLHFPWQGMRLHEAFRSLISRWNQKKYSLQIANRLWGQKGYGFLPEF